MPKPEAAGVRLGLTREDAEQACLARAVQAHDHDPLPALDLEGHVAKHERAAVTLAQAVRGEYDASTVWRFGKRDLHLALAFWRGHLLRLHAVDTLEDRFRGPGALLGLAPHHLGEHAQPLDLRLLPLRQRGQPLFLELPRL